MLPPNSKIDSVRLFPVDCSSFSATASGFCSFIELFSDGFTFFWVSLGGREVFASFRKVKGRSTKKVNIDVYDVCAIFKISIFKFERKYLYSFFDMDLLVNLLNIAKQDML